MEVEVKLRERIVNRLSFIFILIFFLVVVLILEKKVQHAQHGNGASLVIFLKLLLCKTKRRHDILRLPAAPLGLNYVSVVLFQISLPPSTIQSHSPPIHNAVNKTIKRAL